MAMPVKVVDLTIEELLVLIRRTVQAVMAEETRLSATPSSTSLLDIEPISLGAWTGQPDFIRREDYYDDER